MGRKERLREIVASRLTSIVPVCVNFEDPRNAAAILRTSEALGLFEVFVIEEEHPFFPSPKVSLGAERWLKIRRFRRVEPAFSELRSRGFRLFVATPAGSITIEELPFSSPLALVFGNEKEGLSPEVLAQCDGTFRIPMYGFTESLNVSVAAGISLYLATRARRQFLGQPGDLPPAEQEALWAEYLKGAAGGQSWGGQL